MIAASAAASVVVFLFGLLFDVFITLVAAVFVVLAVLVGVRIGFIGVAFRILHFLN